MNKGGDSRDIPEEWLENALERLALDKLEFDADGPFEVEFDFEEDEPSILTWDVILEQIEDEVDLPPEDFDGPDFGDVEEDVDLGDPTW